MSYPKGFCQCGCGQRTVVSPVTDRSHGWVRREPRRFIAGHNNRLLRKAVWEEDRGYETPCHIWRSGLNDRGYGMNGRDGRSRLAHKVLWEERNGPVPDGLTLDHLCRQRDCVNHKHLEPVTHAENCRRGAASRAGDGDHHPILAARLRLQLSQRQAGERLGITQSMVGYWERGIYTTPDELDAETLTWRKPYGANAARIRRAAVIEAYERGDATAEIARVLGISTGTVMVDLQSSRAEGKASRPRNLAFDQERLSERREQTLAMYLDGMPRAEIALSLGITTTTVGADLRALRARGREIPHRNPGAARRDLRTDAPPEQWPQPEGAGNPAGVDPVTGEVQGTGAAA